MTDQSRLISERWDDVFPLLPPVPSGKMGSKKNGEGIRVSVVFEMKWSRNLYLTASES